MGFNAQDDFADRHDFFSDPGLSKWRHSGYILRKIKKLRRSEKQSESIDADQTYIDAETG